MRNLLLVASAIVFLSACGNNNTSSSGKKNTEVYKKLYEKSMSMKDYSTAIMAVQMILLEDSSMASYQDSLPELYAAVNNVEAVSKTIDPVLKRHPKDEKFIQIKSVVQQEQGDYEGVMNSYSTLYELTHKLSYLYQIGTMSFQMGKLDEATKIVDEILSKAPGSKDSLDIFVSEQQKQKVPILAAALNFKGYIFAQKRNLPEAKKYFESALKVFPDFVMAKRNIQQMMAGAQKRPQ
ncbi:MAG: hypothetical protein ACHQK8_06620 [Bacteroidia bacterium]